VVEKLPNKYKALSSNPSSDPLRKKVKDIPKTRTSQVLVADAYNPSYLEGRDQEDHGSKSAPGK
jgi:hypothetical protein